jgi:Zn ribbon nucleic-acid-binding protein
MDEIKRKNHKFTGTLCPECETGKMRSVEESYIRNGVTFTNKVFECSSCGYSEEYKNKRDRRKLDFE